MVSSSSVRVLRVGDQAPWADGLLDQGGDPITAGDLLGTTHLVYFHPRDQTEGCVLPTYGLGIGGRPPPLPVLAVSLDGPEGRREFLERTGGQGFAVVDDHGDLARLYGVEADGPRGIHHAFLVGRDGRIAMTWAGVDTAGLWTEIERRRVRGLP